MCQDRLRWAELRSGKVKPEDMRQVLSDGKSSRAASGIKSRQVSHVFFSLALKAGRGIPSLLRSSLPKELLPGLRTAAGLQIAVRAQRHTLSACRLRRQKSAPVDEIPDME